MFRRFCEKYLPIYIRFWPSFIWLAIWSAPRRYHSHGILGHVQDTHWQALRITLRYGEYHSKTLIVFKTGIV